MLIKPIGGIGPEDQLAIVNGSTSDGDTMISEDQWINLPVGENLMDHPNVRAAFVFPVSRKISFIVWNKS
jgi:cellobiose dehydrogenase (acceptor)